MLLRKREGSIKGKPYQDAKGHLRLTASQQGEDAVLLRVVPEMHHGPVRTGYAAAPGGAFAPEQFIIKNGQQEETFRDLAATLTLRPGQVAVVGHLPERKGSLGDFLFTQPEPNSDRLQEKVLFIWASRPAANDPGTALPPNLVPTEPPDMPERPDDATPTESP